MLNRPFLDNRSYTRTFQNGIKSLWVAIQDIAKEGPVDARHAVIGFLCALVSNHVGSLQSLGSLPLITFPVILSLLIY